MITLSNGFALEDMCYGSAIVDTYRYGSFSKTTRIKHYVRNFLYNKKQFQKDKSLPEIIRLAYDKGLRMYDTSRAYAGSEYVIGMQLKEKKHSTFKIVTKLCNSDQYQGDVRQAFEKSLSELQMDYVDVYLMHWPVKDHFIYSWKQMEELYKEGKCKAIGVCNFNIHHLEELKEHAEILPMVNQFECHPLFTQKALRNYCANNGIQVMAYTATARNDERLRKTALVPIAKKYDKSVTQVILRWHQQVGNIPIVNTSNKEHLLDNINIKDFSLTEDEIEAIERININSRLRYDPDNCDFTQL